MMSFREALLKRLEETKISLRQVADGSGVSYEQLKKLKQIQSRTTNVEDALRVAHFFGQTLEEFMSNEEQKDQNGLVRVLEQLSPEARDVLVNAANAQLAAEKSAVEKSGKV